MRAGPLFPVQQSHIFFTLALNPRVIREIRTDCQAKLFGAHSRRDDLEPLKARRAARGGPPIHQITIERLCLLKHPDHPPVKTPASSAVGRFAGGSPHWS